MLDMFLIMLSDAFKAVQILKYHHEVWNIWNRFRKSGQNLQDNELNDKVKTFSTMLLTKSSSIALIVHFGDFSRWK